MPVAGIYRAFHVDHRVSHDLTLLGDRVFPRCARCGDEVHFELLREAPEAANDEDFARMRLFEIPHPEELKRA